MHRTPSGVKAVVWGGTRMGLTEMCFCLLGRRRAKWCFAVFWPLSLLVLSVSFALLWRWCLTLSTPNTVSILALSMLTRPLSRPITVRSSSSLSARYRLSFCSKRLISIYSASSSEISAVVRWNRPEAYCLRLISRSRVSSCQMRGLTMPTLVKCVCLDQLLLLLSIRRRASPD